MPILVTSAWNGNTNFRPAHIPQLLLQTLSNKEMSHSKSCSGTWTKQPEPAIIPNRSDPLLTCLIHSWTTVALLRGKKREIEAIPYEHFSFFLVLVFSLAILYGPAQMES
jgi:hypothetical protein